MSLSMQDLLDEHIIPGHSPHIFRSKYILDNHTESEQAVTHNTSIICVYKPGCAFMVSVI